jgi:hypothetical protein
MWGVSENTLETRMKYGASTDTASARQQPPTALALGGFFVPVNSLAGQEILDLPDSLNAVGFETAPVHFQGVPA